MAGIRPSVQHDWAIDVAARKGKFWVSCRQFGKPTCYGNVVVKATEGDGIALHGTDGFTAELVHQQPLHLRLSHPAAGAFNFSNPLHEFPKVFSSKAEIYSLDISPGEALGVCGNTKGSMSVFTTDTGNVERLIADAHVGGVYTVRFFPSGKVLLSGGADYRVKVWNAEDGQCAATFTGHAGGVLDTAIVDRGRNVISCSRDGTARLWDCGKSACLGTIAQAPSAINAIALRSATEDLLAPALVPRPETSDREVSTEGQLVLLACEDGQLRTADVRCRVEVLAMRTRAPLNTCAYVSDAHVLAGGDGGLVTGFDLRSPAQPLLEYQRSDSSVLRVASSGSGAFIACDDGSVFSLDSAGQSSRELVGPADMDRTNALCVVGGGVWTAGVDGVVRHYAP